ncbi:hypothetical protein GNI_016780, partial [Gregarina niphandrodes]
MERESLVSHPPPAPAPEKQRRREKQRLKAAVFASKLSAMNGRRHALSFTTIFYFLALHKLDREILGSSPLVVRQSLFLLFAHHVVARGCEVKQLMGFKRACDVKRRQETLWRKTLEWMRLATAAAGKALELHSEDRFFKRVLTGLEEFTDLTLFPRDVETRSARVGQTVHDKQNVVLNPMFAKRLLLNYSEAFRVCLTQTLQHGPLDPDHEGPTGRGPTGRGPAGRGPAGAGPTGAGRQGLGSQEERGLKEGGGSQEGMRPPAAAVAKTVPAIGSQCDGRHRDAVRPSTARVLSTSKLFPFSREDCADPEDGGSSPRKAAATTTMTADSWSVSMAMEKILALQDKLTDADKMRDNRVIADIAERIKHLPTLTQDLLLNAIPVAVPTSHLPLQRQLTRRATRRQTSEGGQTSLESRASSARSAPVEPHSSLPQLSRPQWSQSHPHSPQPHSPESRSSQPQLGSTPPLLAKTSAEPLEDDEDDDDGSVSSAYTVEDCMNLPPDLEDVAELVPGL